MMKKIIDFFMAPVRVYLARRQVNKRLKELRERDPFIYK